MSANFLSPKNWDSATDAGRNNLVFQNRNHAYGAFAIRRDYNHHLFLALFISTGLFLSAFIIPKLLLNKHASSTITIPQTEQVIIQYDITPPVQKIEEPAPSIAPDKPLEKAATQNNVAPVVTDNKVADVLAVNLTITNPGNKTIIGEIGSPIIDKPITDDGNGKEITPPSIPITAEVMPGFPGGEAALFRYLQSNINYPYGARENGIKGTVIVGFVIDVTGKPVMLNILKGIRGGKDLEAEAMRVIGKMPNWTIGLQNNKPTPVQFSLPVKFDLR